MSTFTMKQAGSSKDGARRRRTKAWQETYLTGSKQDEPGERARRALFEASRRHSEGVRKLRAAIMLASAIIVLLFGSLLFLNPLKHLPKNISIGEVQIDGTKVNVEKPKIAGIQQNGRPFAITANLGTEDILNPNILQLSDVRANISLADLSQLEILAKEGIYDNKSDEVVLHGDVRIKNPGNYLIEMSEATLNFKTNVFHSDKFDFMEINDGKITSNTISIINNGDRITFDGLVRSTFKPVP